MLFFVNTHPTSLHASIQIKTRTNLSDNMQSWSSFDPYLCKCIKVGSQSHLTGLL